MKNWYRILQVSETADVETIKAAAKALSRKYHPDNQRTGNLQKMQEVQQAKLILCDPVQRQRFDNDLFETRRPQPMPQHSQEPQFDPMDIVRQNMEEAARNMAEGFADAAQQFLENMFGGLKSQIRGNKRSHYRRRGM